MNNVKRAFIIIFLVSVSMFFVCFMQTPEARRTRPAVRQIQPPVAPSSNPELVPSHLEQSQALAFRIIVGTMTFGSLIIAGCSVYMLLSLRQSKLGSNAMPPTDCEA